MPRAEIHDGRVEVQAEFHEAEAVKLVPGAKWDRVGRVWTIPLAWGPVLALKGVFAGTLEAGPELVHWARGFHEGVVVPAWELSRAEDAPGPEGLYPFQRVGVEFLCLGLGGKVLGDEMGTGKTVQVAAALERLGKLGNAGGGLPALVVCPSPVKTAWARELAKWAPSLTVAVARGNATQRRKAIAEVADGVADVLVASWDVLRLHSRLAPYGSIRLKRCEECGGPSEKPVKPASCETHEKELNEIGWATVVADEAHRASNPKAKWTRALWWLSRGARRRWALTGTSVKDHPDSAFGLLHFVEPSDWPSRTRFIDRYCLQAYNPFSGGTDVVGVLPETRDELLQILDPRFLRRLKEEVLPWLPPKTRVERRVKLKPAQRRIYDELRGDMIASLEGGQLIAWNPLSLGARLGQASCATPYLEDCPEAGAHDEECGCGGAGTVVRLKEPSAKIDELLEILREMGDRPLVAYAPSRQLIELVEARLDKEGITWASVRGGVTESERDEGLERFETGRARVMLLTAAGGEGLTLTRADTIVFLQRPWSLVQSKQAEDRLHRPGAERHEKIMVVDIIAEDTVDERIVEALEEKADSAEQILRDRARLARLLKGEE